MRHFVASRFFSGTAQTLLRAAIGWQVYDVTGSAFQLGMIGLLQFAPTLVLTLVGGAVADTYDRRRVTMTAQAVSVAGSALLFSLTHSGAIALAAIYAVVVANAAADAFGNPARSALLPQLVRRDLFPHAVVVNAVVQNLAWVSGPTLMGYAVDAFGMASAYAIHVALAAAAIATLARVRPRPPQGEGRGVSVDAIREGLAFVRGRAAVLGAMALDMFAVVFASAQALLPIYAQDILQVGSRGFGLLSASFEIGTLAMALLLVARPPLERAGRALCVAVAGYGVATIGFGLSTWFPLSVVAFALAGMADQVSMVARSTLIQLSTPDALRGRVSAVNLVFIGASNQLGGARAGFVAGLTSGPVAVVSGGAIALGALALIAWRVPELRAYRVD